MLLLVQRFFLWVLAFILSGCVSGYKLVKTEQLASQNQCIMTADNNHKLLAQQQQLADGFTRLLAQANSTTIKPRTVSMQPPTCVKPASSKHKKSTQDSEAIAKKIVGATEPVGFKGLAIQLPARIDTGINMAILDARDIQPLERNGESWVRFKVIAANGKAHQVERHLKKRVAVPLRIGESGKKYPVVSMRFVLDHKSQQADFILANRKGEDYPVVLGRLVLRDLMLVDVGRNNAQPITRTQNEKTNP